MDDQHDVDCGCQEYRALSRRGFLGTAASVSLAALFPAWLPKIVMAKSYAANRDVMVSIFLRGGADGLTLCVPFADANYYAARSSIAIPRPDASSPERGVNLDDFFMFPRAMANPNPPAGLLPDGLLPAFRAQDLLIVHAAGQSNNSRSHFDAQRYMEVGKPLDPVLVSGWLGRHLASIPPAKPGALLRALGIANGLQKTLVGPTGSTLHDTSTLPVPDPTNYTVGGSAATQPERLTFLNKDYAVAPPPMRAAALDALNTVELLKTVNFAGYRPANGATYPTNGFGRALRSVAVLIKADVGIEAAQVDIGGWDTHASQNPTFGAMYGVMSDFANSLGAFYADVISTGANVTVVAFSEFGRNVRENGSGGTDHGRASTLFAIGKGIKGGRVLTKNWPGLARENLESGQDLKVTIDYRDVLAEIVQNRLANPNLDFVFPGWRPSFLGVTR
jgi:uncharacterized protein (DUF1501 family)